MRPGAAAAALEQLITEADGATVMRSGPQHEAWKAKAEAVLTTPWDLTRRLVSTTSTRG